MRPVAVLFLLPLAALPGCELIGLGKIDSDCAASEMITLYRDEDLDGYGDPERATSACYAEVGYSATAGDCDDGNWEVKPSASEVCDDLDVDENRDGAADDGAATNMSTWYADGDEDGYGAESAMALACDAPEGYVGNADDCDDAAAAYHPGAEETCSDPNDYNCDGSTEYADGDGDGYAACNECDDTSADVHPEAVELCDDANVDEDCDGVADDDDEEVQDPATWYLDADNDGHGDATVVLTACDPPADYVSAGDDCDLDDPTVSPSAVETCDVMDTDEDCDGAADNSDPDASGLSTWYADVDADGYGDQAVATDACDVPAGHVGNGDDCDDGAASAHPGGTEVCDAADTDEDCDGVAETDATDPATWFADADGDGYGDATTVAAACDAPAGHVAIGDDCDDTSASISPVGTEVCDAADADEDCDGAAETDASDAATWFADADGDGYGDSASSAAACEAPTGYVASASDCDDTSSTISPAGTEVCDDADVDEDCSGTAEDALSSTTWYVDGDGDGYGDSTTSVEACDAPSAGLIDVGGDCDDADADAHPGATEVCDADGVDEDCDGAAGACSFDCPYGLCTWTADGSGDYTFTCDGGFCTLDMTGAGSASVSCAGGGCVNSCSGDATCSMTDCADGACHNDCAGDATCSADCPGGQCSNVCEGDAACSISDCPSGHCSNACSGDAACSIPDCPSGSCDNACDETSECTMAGCTGGFCVNACDDTSECTIADCTGGCENVCIETSVCAINACSGGDCSSACDATATCSG